MRWYRWLPKQFAFDHSATSALVLPKPAPSFIRPCLLLRSLDALMAARAEGRVDLGYETGIRVGRAYQARPWLVRLERALGFKPHTIGIWVTNRLLTMPPAPPEDAGGSVVLAAS